MKSDSDSQKPGQDELKRAVDALKGGGLVVFPTETFYGLAADIQNPAALERLAGLKGRDADKPFGLIAADQGQVDGLASQIPAQAAGLMARHWPGPLTIILAARPGLSPRLVSKGGGVAIRISPHPVASALARGLGRAITATSANPGGGPAPRSLAELDPAIAKGVDMVIDGGPTPGGPASTLVDMRFDPPRLLRPGVIQVPGAVAPDPG